jgi:hypothetical protein
MGSRLSSPRRHLQVPSEVLAATTISVASSPSIDPPSSTPSDNTIAISSNINSVVESTVVHSSVGNKVVHSEGNMAASEGNTMGNTAAPGGPNAMVHPGAISMVHSVAPPLLPSSVPDNDEDEFWKTLTKALDEFHGGSKADKEWPVFWARLSSILQLTKYHHRGSPSVTTVENYANSRQLLCFWSVS